MCVIKHKLVRILFSEANVANTLLIRIRCAGTSTLFSDANVDNAVLLRIICAADLRPAFLLYAKIPPMDVIFSLSLDRSWDR